MLIPFGVLSAAGGGVAPFESDFELIQSFTVGTAVSSVTFSSLATYASTYKHLQVRSVARSSTIAATVPMDLVVNADTSANYAFHQLQGSSTSATSSATANSSFMFLATIWGDDAVANIFGVSVTDLLDAYSTTKNKTIRTLGGNGATLVQLTSGHRRSTEAISSLEVKPRTGNFMIGSRFSLYGVKG